VQDTTVSAAGARQRPASSVVDGRDRRRTARVGSQSRRAPSFASFRPRRATRRAGHEHGRARGHHRNKWRMTQRGSEPRDRGPARERHRHRAPDWSSGNVEARGRPITTGRLAAPVSRWFSNRTAAAGAMIRRMHRQAEGFVGISWRIARADGLRSMTRRRSRTHTVKESSRPHTQRAAADCRGRAHAVGRASII